MEKSNKIMRTRKQHLPILSMAVLLLLLLGVCLSSCASCLTLDMGEAVLSYKGEEITTVELTYWMSTLKTRYLSGIYGEDTSSVTFWETENEDGQTHKQQFDDLLLRWLKELVVAKYLYRSWDLDSAPSKSEIKSEIKDLKQYYEEEPKEWQKQLDRLGVTEESLVQIRLGQAKLVAVRERMIADLQASDRNYSKELERYYLENYANVTFATIYLNVDSEDMEKLSQEEAKKKEEKVQEALAKALGGETPAKILSDYSEFDMTNFPNGIFISLDDAANYGTKFCQKALEMKDGEWIRFDMEAEEVKCAYLIYKMPLGDYSKMSENEKSDLQDRTLSAFCSESLMTYTEEVTLYTEIWDQYSVITAQASKNTNF